MLTERQHDLLVFIDRYIRERGHSPSFQEMSQGVGIKSKSGVARMVAGLIERGYLRQIPNRHRGIEVVRMPPSHPAASAIPMDAATLALLRDAEANISARLEEDAPLHFPDKAAEALVARLRTAIAAATPTNQQEPTQ